MLRSPIGSWFIAAGILLIPFSLAVGAESFPTRPIRLIVPFPPGSQPDTVARILVDQLSRDFGIVVVENRPGAGGTTGMKAAAAADPDGYTLVLGTTGSLTLGPAFFANAGYDPVRSFAPVAMIASAPFMLVVAPTLPVSTYAELVAYLKANPGKLSFGANTGSPPQFACDNFKRVTGTDMVHVVSRGPQAIADLLGGHVQVICEATTLLLPLVASRQAKPIIVMSAARLPELPDVPSTAEVSLPNSSITVWTGIVAPAGTPADITGRLNAAINKSLDSTELKERLAKLGTQPRPTSVTEFGTFITDEAAAWSAMVQRSGIKPQ